MNFNSNIVLFLLCSVISNTSFAQQEIVNESSKPFSTITESTPSKAMYFDWININWYGSNEHKVTRNLEFFKWMHDEYGMELDIYLIDAGTFDNGPKCNHCESPLKNVPTYGGLDSEWFQNKFPNGLQKISELAASFGCEMGMWIGPDGFGNDAKTAMKRVEMLERLVKDNNIALLKMDACCSDLDENNSKYFVEAMERCYAANPDLIVLNHRIDLPPEAQPYPTTFLWEGKETYIDVSARNETPSIHHRYSLDRGLPPELKRLTEDHGVCLSSCLDFWQDDLILQAFNRNLILSPEIYGNPWLLNDDEFSQLARIFNLHRKYNDILVDGIELPKERYGKYAVSRGDSNTRLVTLRNLGWEEKTFAVKLDESIGLKKCDQLEVRTYHPTERVLGTYRFGDEVMVSVHPFRACLIKVSSEMDEFGIIGCDYQVVRAVSGEPLEVDLLGVAGERLEVSIAGNRRYRSAMIDGKPVSELTKRQSTKVSFKGEQVSGDFHHLMGELEACDIPENPTLFLDTMYFANDNDCLEVRSLERSGDTRFEAVKQARDAFFNDEVFLHLGPWHKLALDQNPDTAFKVRNYCNLNKPGTLRIELPEKTPFDKLELFGTPEDYHPKTIKVSEDLSNWSTLQLEKRNGVWTIENSELQSVRYLKIDPAPAEISELYLYANDSILETSNVRISNLFPNADTTAFQKAWKGTFQVTESYGKHSYLAVALPGEYGPDGAFAVVELENDGTLIGAYDRSPSYPFNNWEHMAAEQNGNYTYYFKLPLETIGQPITVHAFALQNSEMVETPRVWQTAYPIPFERKRLILE